MTKRQRSATTRGLAQTLACLALCLPALASAQLYKWVDENGQVHYGDRIPPKYAKKERKELNEQGVVVNTRERELTASELAERERQAAEMERETLASKERARYDRYLVTTYSSVADLIAVRDERLSTIDSRIALAKKNTARTEDTLTRLLAQRESLESSNKPVPDKLQAQISEYEQGLVNGLRGVRNLEDDRVEIESKFNRDMERYLELTSR